MGLWWSTDFAHRDRLLCHAADFAALDTLPGLPHAQVSLSHSKHLLVVAAMTSGSGIGVDVEPLRPLRLPRALAFFANSTDIGWWQAQPNPDAAAIQLWTQKEAAYKAYIRQDRQLKPLGISQRRTVTGPYGQTVLSWCVRHPADTREGQGLTFKLTPDHWVSVCVLSPL